MQEYKISLDRKVLKLLGSQLYGDVPSIIAELVANSYDADAKNVWITVNTENNAIVIEDDGKGMTAEEINTHFLNIGYNKREEEQAVTGSGRKVMGRKGIGKLAVFSLTKCVNVLSCKAGEKSGCFLDFNEITEHDKEPQAIHPDEINFSKDRLSDDLSGTRLELIEIKKKINYSYRFILSRLIRTFDVNEENFKVHIRKNEEEYKQIERSKLNYFSIMDTIVTIGEEFSEKKQLVLDNSIPQNIKFAHTYEEFVEKSPRIKLSKFPYQIEVENKQGEFVKIDFSFSGWIGTVNSLPNLNAINEQAIGAEDENEDDKLIVYDNRVSLFARNKLGEYDILSKVKTDAMNDAYVIGELYVDIFEDNSLIDMAISNRRGYDENDRRYIEVIKIAKKIVSFVVREKTNINKITREEFEAKQKQEEIEKIVESFTTNTATKDILSKKLDPDEIKTVESQFMQFSRAVNIGGATKKIFISHKEQHKLYGQFIVDVLEKYGIDAGSTIIFTSNAKCGVPKGQDIYDYLKSCFREDLLVIFIFSKAFYDSNACISEGGAAWATNKNYFNVINVIIDIGFDDVEKPLNNSISGIKFKALNDTTQIEELNSFFSAVLSSVGFEPVDTEKLSRCINETLTMEKYKKEVIDNPPLYYPSRKFLPKITCPKCRNEMKLTRTEEKVFYKCSNVGCPENLAVTFD